MYLEITPGEALEKGIWDQIKGVKGYSSCVLNEGMNKNKEIRLNKEEIEECGIVIVKKSELNQLEPDLFRCYYQFGHCLPPGSLTSFPGVYS